MATTLNSEHADLVKRGQTWQTGAAIAIDAAQGLDAELLKTVLDFDAAHPFAPEPKRREHLLKGIRQQDAARRTSVRLAHQTGFDLEKELTVAAETYMDLLPEYPRLIDQHGASGMSIANQLAARALDRTVMAAAYAAMPRTFVEMEQRYAEAVERNDLNHEDPATVRAIEDRARQHFPEMNRPTLPDIAAQFNLLRRIRQTREARVPEPLRVVRGGMGPTRAKVRDLVDHFARLPEFTWEDVLRITEDARREATRQSA